MRQLYQESPALLLRRTRFSFTEGFELPGWGEGLPGRGQGWGPSQWLCVSMGQGHPPHPALLKGSRDQRTPSLLRPVLLLIQPDDMYLTDSCTMFTIADSKHLHAHQFLR